MKPLRAVLNATGLRLYPTCIVYTCRTLKARLHHHTGFVATFALLIRCIPLFKVVDLLLESI